MANQRLAELQVAGDALVAARQATLVAEHAWAIALQGASHGVPYDHAAGVVWSVTQRLAELQR